MIARRFRYSYQTLVRYEGMVSHNHFQLRCTPIECSYQRVIDSNIQLLNSANIAQGVDSFGTPIHYGSIMQRHDIFVVLSSGEVRCSPYRVEDAAPAPIYLMESALTRISDDILAWSESFSRSDSALNQSLAIASALHNYMNYSSGSTSTQTTASQSFEQREGVCQDYSHILISIMRARGVAARYVAGLVMGTGESHAWVEIYYDGAWYGVDPTHNCLVEWGYIKLSHGRDASDCSLTRGVHRGAYNHSTQVRVIVEEIF